MPTQNLGISDCILVKTEYMIISFVVLQNGQFSGQKYHSTQGVILLMREIMKLK